MLKNEKKMYWSWIGGMPYQEKSKWPTTATSFVTNQLGSINSKEKTVNLGHLRQAAEAKGINLIECAACKTISIIATQRAICEKFNCPSS